MSEMPAPIQLSVDTATQHVNRAANWLAMAEIIYSDGQSTSEAQTCAMIARAHIGLAQAITTICMLDGEALR